MTKTNAMREEEALAAKYRKFDEHGNRIYDSLSYQQMQGILKAIYSGGLEVIGPDAKPVSFDDKRPAD